MRSTLKSVLAAVGGLGAARSVAGWFRQSPPRIARPSEHPSRQAYDEGYPEFARRYGAVLAPRAGSLPRTPRTALVVSSRQPAIEVELALLKTIQVAGLHPVVLLDGAWSFLRPYYELAGASVEIALPAGARTVDANARARALAASFSELADFLAFESRGVRIGQIALSSGIRRSRRGRLEWHDEGDRAMLAKRLAISLTALDQAHAVVDRIRPALAVFVDSEYSPWAELFETCLGHGADVVAYDLAHKRNALVFKRYRADRRRHYLASLSDETWQRVRRMPWNASHRAALQDEIDRCYADGDWFGACWTQTHTEPFDAQSMRASLGLDPGRRTAVVFSHILWDAPLSWARTIFSTYEAWLVETVRAACANDHVNWVIKIHPANVGRSAADGLSGEPAEVLALRRYLGTLPPHVHILPADSPIRTTSLLSITDVCLTVRGTVGLEAARMGIPVVTAADSRYSGLGFTIDSPDRETYLERIRSLHEIEPLDPGQRDLAERFAYAMFLMRPHVCGSATWRFGEVGMPTVAEIHVTDAAQWEQAPDVRALATWLADPARPEDYLSTPAGFEEHR